MAIENAKLENNSNMVVFGRNNAQKISNLKTGITSIF